MPSLLEKMYEDTKVGGKWLGKKTVNEKKEKKKKKKRKKRKKPLTRNQKIAYTVILLICIPLGLLFFVYYNSGLMQTILLAKGLYKTERNLGIPTDPEKIPYAKSTVPGSHTQNSKSVFDLMDKQNKKQTKQPNVQRGGSSFNKAENDNKAMLDSTKFGFPYSWYDNDNIGMRGLSAYFVTFWTFMRGGLVKLLDVCNSSLYSKGYEGHPEDLGGQVFDFIKFTSIIPLISIIIYVGTVVLGTGGLLWSSINDQTLLLPFWIVVGILSLVMGIITTITVAGVTVSYLNVFIAFAVTLLTSMVCFFWPYGFFWLYTQAMILRVDENKKKLFRNYLKNYELCWILTMVSLLGVSISYVWDWDIIPRVAFGGVGGSFILLRAMGLF